MKPVREVVGRDVIEDLWGAGYTVLPRRRHPDPFFVEPGMVPQGRAYQWWHLVHDKFHFERPHGNSSGWAPVPASRHDGYFMPTGHVGAIEVEGLGLFEKSKVEVDQELDQNGAAAHKLVSDWMQKAAADGLSGQISVGGVGADVGSDEVIKNATTKTIETRVRLPQEMMPYMGEVFAERDRLYADLLSDYAYSRMNEWQTRIYLKYTDAVAADPETAKGPTLNALLLPYAIENVRKSLVPPYQPPTE